jgi:hypothetical protein
MIGVAGEVRGLKTALATLNELDKKARRDITKEYKTIVKPVVDDAKQNVPRQAPISGWARNWTTKSGFKMLPWQGDIGANTAATFKTWPSCQSPGQAWSTPFSTSPAEDPCPTRAANK